MRALTAIVAFVLLQQTPALRIVVVEGEGAVNIIQQKTAVRPLVEVRDRNNVPVAGATVTFTIGGGGQSAVFAGGAQTLTVTTNAAGQAAASGINALGSGAFQIQVQAAYQGQLATAAITQTNVATAAAASQAGAGAGGAAGGGGGGISATTIGIIGGAVAGGAVAATQVAGNQDSDEDSFDGYSGPFGGQLTLSSVFDSPVGPGSSCTFTYAMSGTLSIELRSTGTSSATLLGTITMTSASSTCIFDGVTRNLSLLREDTPVAGAPSALTFSRTLVDTVQSMTWRFTGALSGNNINGTLLYDVTPAPNANPRHNGSTTMPVTLVGPRP
jgi:hypothetical protein